jgi:drug/metabolite transporter (DMT)-like permease
MTYAAHAAYAVAVLCVVAIAVGQILFKACANSLQQTGSLLAPSTALILLAALVLYGITTFAWVWVLRNIALGRAYPLMALAFVLVPIGSHVVFGERFQPLYFAGVALIAAGIVVIASSQ